MYEGSACWALTEVAIAPGGGYPEAVEYIDGMGNTIASAIAAVIVGCREDIKPASRRATARVSGEENMG